MILKRLFYQKQRLKTSLMRNVFDSVKLLAVQTALCAVPHHSEKSLK